MDDNFIKIKATACQYAENIFQFTALNQNKSYYKNYDLLLGRQLPFSKKNSVSIAAGVSHLHYYSEYNPSAPQTPFDYTKTGVPIELTLMRTTGNLIGGNVTFEYIFTNKEHMGNITIGIALGKVREKLKDDKRL